MISGSSDTTQRVLRWLDDLARGQHQEKLTALDALKDYTNDDIDWAVFADAVEGWQGDTLTNRIAQFIMGRRLPAATLFSVMQKLDWEGVPDEQQIYNEMVSTLPDEEWQAMWDLAMQAVHAGTTALKAKNLRILWAIAPAHKDLSAVLMQQCESLVAASQDAQLIQSVLDQVAQNYRPADDGPTYPHLASQFSAALDQLDDPLFAKSNICQRVWMTDGLIKVLNVEQPFMHIQENSTCLRDPAQTAWQLSRALLDRLALCYSTQAPFYNALAQAKRDATADFLVMGSEDDLEVVVGSAAVETKLRDKQPNDKVRAVWHGGEFTLHSVPLPTSPINKHPVWVSASIFQSASDTMLCVLEKARRLKTQYPPQSDEYQLFDQIVYNLMLPITRKQNQP